MKTTLLFLFISINCQAQKKGDNTILIPNKSIKEIKQVLFNNGFTVEGSDTSFFVTTAKQMKTASVLRLMFARNDTSIIIKGQAKIQVKLMGTDMEFTPVEYRSSKSNLNNEWFREMDKVAKGLSDKVVYRKD